ncbi:MAG: EAL domain-containing protein [Candidatus Binatia bacterium]
MGIPIRVLIIEDCEDDALLSVQELRRGGYDPIFERVDTSSDLKAALVREAWDLVISDYAMPRFCGLEALKLVQSAGRDTPYIFVSGTIGEDTAVAAMRAGAHDYIMKGNLKRLAPAVERELRDAGVRWQQKLAEERLRHLAYYDAVTNLPNATLLDERLEQAIAAAGRNRGRVALLVMKLNRFTQINETLGHQTADLLLRWVGPRLSAELCELATLACIRSNEFAVLLPSVQDIEESTKIAQKILKAFQEPFVLDELKLEVQPTLGIALFPEHASTADSLVKRASLALSAAQKNHRDYEVYSVEHDQSSSQQLTLIGELRRAITEGQLFLLYQPKIELQTGRVTGVEALVRWQHPRLGLIPPDQFIPLAESTGLILSLTLRVVREALSQCALWNQRNLNLGMAVNLSTWDLQAAELPERIGAMLGAFKVPAAQLDLEITESVIMANPERAMESVIRLRDMGARVSIDDFGTGYSSLSYLARLPVDQIKIDKSFVMKMIIDERASLIVQSTIGLAHDLGLKVVAEGVENKPILDALKDLGCDSAQGYYISRPILGADLPGRLSSLMAA